MKKITALLLALLLLVGVLAGCGKQNDTNKTDKLSIVTTIFPEYDWVREILGDKADNAEVTMLLDNGVDLHSYQPTADDIVKISDCDLFIYVGGESDGWVDDALKNATNKNMKVINLLDVLGDSVKTEEVVDGMQETEHDHDHDHSKEVSTFEDDEVQDRSLSDWAGDWQSAYPFVLDGTLEDAFAVMAEKGEMTAEEYKTYYQNGYKTDITNIDIEGDHIEFTYEDSKKVGSNYKYVGYYIQNWSTGTKAAMYRFEAEDKDSGAPVYIEFNDHMIEPAAAAAYTEKLSALDGEYQAAVDAATYKTVLFGDRFPFRYLVDDYGLSYYAAFVGCSAETEASFETVSFLAKKVDESKLPCVLTIEGAQHKISETIVQNTVEKNQKVLTMDSMQSTTSNDVASGTTYLSVMEKNLSVLKEALG
nr:ZinT/AdcA family metal-binding protein [uncultured Agathobaculum sp.]